MFIGTGMDEAAIVALLDQALLSDEEMVRETASRAGCQKCVQYIAPGVTPSMVPVRHSPNGGHGPQQLTSSR